MAQVAKLTPDGQAAITTFREAVQNVDNRLGALRRLEKELTSATETAAQVTQPNTPQIKALLESTLGSIAQGTAALEKARPAAQNAKNVLENAAEKLSAIGMDREWTSLYNALQFLPIETRSPFGAFALLMASLQAAGVGLILLILQYRELRSMIRLIGSIILVLVTTYVQWLNFCMKRHFHADASPQIAAMIQDIRQQRKPDARSSDPEAGA